MPEPRIRSNMLKSVLNAIDAREESERRAVRARLQPEAIQAIESAAPLAWMDWELQGALNDAIAGELGELEAIGFWRDLGLASFQQPTFKVILETSRRILGASPGSVLKYWHIGYRAVAKDAGKLRVNESEPGRTLMAYRDVPHVVLRPSYVYAHRGSLLATCPAFGFAGDTEVVDYDRDEGVLDVLVTWSSDAEDSRT